MFHIFYILLFSCLRENFTLRRNQEEMVFITSYTLQTCTILNESIANFSYTPNIKLNDSNLISTLQSSTGIELNSTSCALEGQGNFTCTFNFTEKGIYYLKSFISEKYKFLITASLLTQIRIGFEECKLNLSEIATSINKRTFILDNIGCQPEIYAKMNNSYYMLLCTNNTEEKQFKCFLPSNFEITSQEQIIQFASRTQCGQLTDENKNISVFDTYIEGDKYINQNETKTIQHYYTITTTKEDNITLYSFKKEMKTMPLINCTQIQTSFPYKYNCTLSKSDPLEIEIYNFYYNETNYVKNSLEIYEHKTIDFSVIKPSNTTPNNESKQISFILQDDTIKKINNRQGNTIRGFTFKSNSLQVTFEKLCDFDIVNEVIDYKKINCWIIAPENCTIDFYYRNQTEHYVLIKQASLTIGNGLPNYNNHFQLKLSYFLFFVIFLI